MITLTRELAWAAATDEANRYVRKKGKKKWDRKAYNVACKKFNELWPISKDLEGGQT